MEKVQILVELETNIWACIYRGLNRKRNIEYQAVSQVTKGQDTGKFDSPLNDKKEFEEDKHEEKSEEVQRSVKVDFDQGTEAILKSDRESELTET